MQMRIIRIEAYNAIKCQPRIIIIVMIQLNSAATAPPHSAASAGCRPAVPPARTEMYVCLCHAVTDHEIRAAVSLGADTLDAIGEQLGVGTRCGCCRDTAAKLISDCRGCPAARRCGETAAS
jgi:bacterioferritin-associated ferredoxin